MRIRYVAFIKNGVVFETNLGKAFLANMLRYFLLSFCIFFYRHKIMKYWLIRII